MKLRKYHPFSPVSNSLNTFFDGFFDNSIADFVGTDFIKSHPSINVIESDTQFKIEVAAPGLSKEDFDLSLEKDQLTISATKEVENEVKEEKYTRREFNYTAFKRSFTLPENVKVKDITASYENGVLGIVLPKKSKANKEVVKTINIS